ncbi:unnamed protein product [Cunninghamella echinulata]
MIGPLCGGFLVERWGWRSVFWLLFVMGCLLLVSIIFVMEETYRVEDFWNKTIDDSGMESNNDQRSIPSEKTVAKKSLNPFAPLLLLRHPFVFICSMSTALAFGGMFAIENMIPELYTNTYSMSAGMIGLTFLSPGIGEVVGSVFSGQLSNFYLYKAMNKRGYAVPEDRLALNVWPAAFLLNPLAFFLWGWPVQLEWSVWVSIIMFGVQCFAMVNIFNPALAYLVDAVHGKGASVTAAANLVRMVWSCILSLIANPMTHAVGPGWVTFLFGILNLVWAFALLVVKLKGEKLRKYSGY